MELSDDLEPIPKIRNISYLYARDPSIVAYNRGDNIRHPKDLRHDLAAEDPVISSSTEKSKVSTFCRTKQWVFCSLCLETFLQIFSMLCMFVLI